MRPEIFGSDRGDVAVDLGVVGGFAIVEIKEEPKQRARSTTPPMVKKRRTFRAEKALWRQVGLARFRRRHFDVCRILQSNFDLNTHRVLTSSKSFPSAQPSAQSLRAPG